LATSALDSNTYKKGLAAALKIKGTKEAPNEVNVDQIQIIADAMQGGFSHYEHHQFTFPIIFEIEDTKDVIIFSPVDGLFSPDNVQNNRLWEIRLIGARVVVTGITPVDQDKIQCQLRLNDLQTGGTDITFIRWELEQKTGKLAYSWAFPAMTTDEEGQFQQFQAWNWLGHLPAGKEFAIRLQKDTSFDGSENGLISFFFVRVPRGSVLPL